jgi:DNA-directed RNA polymerase subunit A'
MKDLEIGSIKFSLISEENVRSIAAFEVTQSEIYDENGPIVGGLRDARLGPTCIGSEENQCPVCDLTVQECGGHFGCIEFPLHMYHINRVNDVIRSLKRRCMKCYADVSNAKKKLCPECNEKLPKIEWNSKKCTVTVNGKDTPAHNVVEWLGEDKRLLMKNMLVPPNAVRPPPTVGGEEIMGEDNTTRGLLQIVRSVKGLRNRIRSSDPQTIIDATTGGLQKHLNLYIDRQRTTKTRGGQSLADSMRGKGGWFRGNLQGKRCNGTARTVVTGDPMLGMREVGVPKSIANTLTKRVMVNSINIRQLSEYLRQGHIKTVFRGKQMYDLSKKRGSTVLMVGDEVERSLMDGDYVLFNRQPSLHRMSIMAHRVRILPWSTFRLNLSCTPPYNADFDGDEMNLHSLIGREAEAEMACIMAVEHNFITPSSHRPVMSIVQDTLLALFLISHPDYYFSFAEMHQWFYYAGLKGQPPTEKRNYSGLEVVSFSLPDTLNYTRGDFKVSSGVIVSGRITKKILGSSDGSLIHVLVNDYGGSKTCDIIDTLQRGVSQWSYTMGFSIGISDMVPDKETTKKIQIACDAAYASIQPEDTEDQINTKLNGARDSMGKLAISNTKESNRLRLIIESGAKGSMINIMQVSAAVGQQNCKGKRITPSISGRTLPCFSADDNGGRARGFVRSPYISGMKADEFFVHAIGGREGLCDTAIKTSQTGYVQRRLAKAMESLVVQHDHTVRDNQSRIVQFVYGDDGFDPTAIELDGADVPVPVPMRRILKRFADGKRGGKHKAPKFDNEMVSDYVKDAVREAPSMSKAAFKKACDEAKRRYVTGRVEVGESVGVVAAQSIGEPVTQLTLNTFHSAGNSASNVTLGIPRFEELINGSNSAKIRRNFFKTATPQDAFNIMNNIRETQNRHLVKVAVVEPAAEKKEHDLFRMFPDHPLYEGRKNYWMITVHISRKAMVQRNITMETVIEIVHKNGKGKVEVHYNVPKDKDPLLCIYFLDPHVVKSKIRAWLNTWMTTKLRGIKGISGAFITRDGFETVGSNLRETLLIDSKVTSDDVWDVLNVLGIEAAREVLYREINRVLKANGAYVGSRHIKLLADWMTLEGDVRGTTRHGQKSSGILARASYEQPVEVLQQAAIHNKEDKIEGVSEQLIFGKPPNIGGQLTGMVTDVVTKRKESRRGWNGNFQFTKKKRKVTAAPFKPAAPEPQQYNPPAFTNPFGGMFANARPGATQGQQTAQQQPWMMAQSW